MLERGLSRVAKTIAGARPDSRLGRLAAAIRRATRTRMLDSRSLDEFDDLWTHERMLADEVRTGAYERAIAQQIGEGDVVVDLGTGTGILGMLAARRAKKVYAVDHSGIIEAARLVAEANGASNIEFVRSNSRHFTPAEPVDVILHEQIGDELFEENMVENVVDLRTRLLRPGGRILPARFALFVEPVMLKDGENVPAIWQMNVHGIDFSSLRNQPALAGLPSSGELRWLNRVDVDHLLCEPEPVYTLDLMTASAHALPTVFRSSRAVTRPGRLDGLFVYLGVDFGGGVSFDTSPSTRTSWGNRYFRLRSTPVALGDRIEFRIDVPEAREIATWIVTLTSPALGRVRG